MGIKNLNSILLKKGIPIYRKKMYELKMSIVAIDFSLFYYRFLYNKNNPVECFLKQITMFFKHNILPLYVLDGTAPVAKQFILEKRNSKRQKIIDELNILSQYSPSDFDSNEDILKKRIEKLEKKCIKFNSEDLNKLVTFFNLLGIPVISTNYESDWILSILSKEKLVDYVLSEDSDLLTFGTKRIIRNFSLMNESFNLYELDEILHYLRISHEQLVEISILCGCDYCSKIKCYTCYESFENIQKYGSIENLYKKNIIKENEYNRFLNVKKIFLKKPSEGLKNELKELIVKEEFDFENLEKFLTESIPNKNYLIDNFIYVCKNFIHYKTRTSGILDKILKKNK